MADELEDLDKVFKYVELESGDHHLSIQRNRHLFFKEMDAFLDAHLKPAKSGETMAADLTTE
jgi:dipeptidyl aminopeptidase/acylaminoacyl peptidase